MNQISVVYRNRFFFFFGTIVERKGFFLWLILDNNLRVLNSLNDYYLLIHGCCYNNDLYGYQFKLVLPVMALLNHDISLDLQPCGIPVVI